MCRPEIRSMNMAAYTNTTLMAECAGNGGNGGTDKQDDSIYICDEKDTPERVEKEKSKCYVCEWVWHRTLAADTVTHAEWKCMLNLLNSKSFVQFAPTLHGVCTLFQPRLERNGNVLLSILYMLIGLRFVLYANWLCRTRSFASI